MYDVRAPPDVWKLIKWRCMNLSLGMLMNTFADFIYEWSLKASRVSLCHEKWANIYVPPTTAIHAQLCPIKTSFRQEFITVPCLPSDHHYRSQWNFTKCARLRLRSLLTDWLMAMRPTAGVTPSPPQSTHTLPPLPRSALPTDRMTASPVSKRSHN